MEKNDNPNLILQQVGAYATKHKMEERDIPLLKEQEDKEVPANHHRSQ